MKYKKLSRYVIVEKLKIVFQSTKLGIVGCGDVVCTGPSLKGGDQNMISERLGSEINI
jgi:hypothetical protein